MRYCINNFGEGRTSHFASQVEVPLKSVQGWLRGERVPTLQAILQMTYRIGIQLLPFLCGSSEIGDDSLNRGVGGNNGSDRKSKTVPLSHDEVKKILVSAASNDRPKPLQAFVRLTGWSRVKLQNQFPELCAAILARYADYFYRRIDEAKALAVLQAALMETPPLSIVAIAQPIRCNAVSLKYRFPDITRELVSRYKSYWRNTDWQLVEASLKEALFNYPPSSMSETARSLGLSQRGMRMRFPELTRAIAHRFKKYVKAKAETRKERLCQEILGIVAELNSGGIYPSVKRVAARVKASRNMLEIRLTLRALKTEITSNPVS